MGTCKNDGWSKRDELCRIGAQLIAITRRPTIVDSDVAAIDPTQFLQARPERRNIGLPSGVALGESHQHADPPHPLALLRACRERPRRRSAEKRDELAALHHSITSSDSASNLSGISRPSAFAVLRLITNSNLVGCSTGKSAGLAPFSRLLKKLGR